MQSGGKRVVGAVASWSLIGACLLAPAAVRAAIGTPQAIGSAGARTASTGTTVLVTGSVPLNGTVIVTAAIEPVVGPVGCTDTVGNTYSVDADATNGSGTSGVRTIVCSATAAVPLVGGADAVIVSHPSTDRRTMTVMSVTGLAAAARVDETATGTGASSAVTSGTAAPTDQPNELLIGGFAAESKKDTLLTPGAGYTLLASESSGNAGAPDDNVTTYATYRIVAATGAYAATGTLGQARSGVYGPLMCGSSSLRLISIT